MPKISLKNIAIIGSLGGETTASVSSSTGSTHTYNGVNYYKFTGTGSITFSKAGWVKLLVIGGGGGGANKYYGSGGGAGGIYFDFVEVTASNYSITIGASDNNSVALGKTALKGGHGVRVGGGNGVAGGCGAGNSYRADNINTTGLQPTSTDGGFGFNGGNAGITSQNPSPDTTNFTYNSNVVHSGGGAGTAVNGGNGYGTTIGNGGDGRTDSQLDNFLTATGSGAGGALGGGGGAAGVWQQYGTGGNGGSGGGANSGLQYVSGSSTPQGGNGGTGAINTGGGGGASGRYGVGGNGGSGLCLIGLIAP